jgi:uncharacterized protein (DUF1778 family)
MGHMTSGTETRQRTAYLAIRMTPEEKSALLAKANQSGHSVAAFSRAVLLGSSGPRSQRRLPIDHADLRRLLGALNQLGNNVNQIAHALNAGDAPEYAIIHDAVRDVAQMREAVLSALRITTSVDPRP